MAPLNLAMATKIDSSVCSATLAATKSAVAADRALDPLYVQALDAATRSYCG